MRHQMQFSADAIGDRAKNMADALKEHLIVLLSKQKGSCVVDAELLEGGQNVRCIDPLAYSCSLNGC